MNIYIDGNKIKIEAPLELSGLASNCCVEPGDEVAKPKKAFNSKQQLKDFKNLLKELKSVEITLFENYHTPKVDAAREAVSHAPSDLRTIGVRAYLGRYEALRNRRDALKGNLRSWWDHLTAWMRFDLATTISPFEVQQDAIAAAVQNPETTDLTTEQIYYPNGEVRYDLVAREVKKEQRLAWSKEVLDAIESSKIKYSIEDFENTLRDYLK